MNRKFLYLALCLAGIFVLSCRQQSEQTTAMTFSSENDRPSFSWALKDIAPNVPSDFSGYNWLVLEMKASSPQRFHIGLVTPGGLLHKGIQPFPGARIRFAIPLDYFRNLPASAVDMAATYNKKRALGMINIHNEAVGQTVAVDSICFFMNAPVNNPTLEIYSVSLSVEDPGDATVDNIKLVDSFGQWATQSWEGKIQSQQELDRAWQAENESLSPLMPEASVYGGYGGKKYRATGFFRVEKIDGKWWFVDPEGCLFLSTGVDCVNASSSTRTADREYIFESLRDSSGFADYYKWNIERRYGGERQAGEEWINTAIRRMQAWGLNTIANWSSRDIIQAERMPFVLSLPGLQLEKGVMGLPDVYDRQYSQEVDRAIAGMAERFRNNRWLLGYFVGNEQPWPGQETILCDRILAGDERPFKAALKKHIELKGDSPQSKKDFVYKTFDSFLSLVNTSLKKHDPNHLNLGMRFGGETSDELLALAGRHFDVFSYNCYSLSASHEFLDRIDRQTGLPALIGEYHFGVPDRGMAAGIVQVASQKDRGTAYRSYNEQAYAHPSLIGAHWFQWIDQPNTGRMDGENYNIGLLDVTDRPYQEMVKAMRETHSRLFEIHGGSLKPYNEQARLR